jgi:putative membrane protein
MKRLLQKSTALLLGALLLAGLPASALAQSNTAKEEAVYINLAHDGTVKNIYVVNAFDLTEEGTVTDYGQYAQTRNMSTDAQIKTEGDAHIFQASKGRFYYQGNMTGKDMPWTIGLEYLLDGKPEKAEELAGKSGSLEIKMSIRQNKNVNEVFFKHFVLQAVFTLDTEKCVNISAQGATIADAGSDQLLTFMIMPDKEKDISIKADVSDFCMDGIQIKGVPLSLDIDSPDTTDLKENIYDLQDGAKELDDGADTLYDGTGELKDGVSGLKAAVNEIKSGADQLSAGAKQIKDGMAALNEKSGTLVSGSQAVKQALDQINAGLSALSSMTDALTALKDGSTQFLENIHALNDQAKTLPSASQNIGDVMNDCIGTLTTASAHDSDLSAAVSRLGASADPDVQALIAAYTQKTAAVTGVKSALSTLAEQYAAFDTGVGNTADAIAQLTAAYADINSGVQRIVTDGLLGLASGMQALAAQYSPLDAGIKEYTTGFGKLVSGYNGVYAGVASLSDGIALLQTGVKKLYSGAADLNDGAEELSGGTQELKDKTADMDSEVDDKVNEMIEKYTKPDYTLVSFTSEKNKNIQLVQFVIQTEEISLEEETTIEDHGPKNNQSFWDKFIGLFK